MMILSEPVKRLYKEAIADKLFMKRLRTADPHVPKQVNVLTDNTIKLGIAIAYEGYLIALGEYDNDKYY